jgi:hypothetical protein
MGPLMPPAVAPPLPPAPMYHQQSTQQPAIAMQQMMLQQQILMLQQQLHQTQCACGLSHLASPLVPYRMQPLEPHLSWMSGVLGTPCSAAILATASDPGNAAAGPSGNIPAAPCVAAIPATASGPGYAAAGPPLSVATAAASLSANNVPWGQLLDLATDAKGSRVLQDAVLHLSNSQLVGVREELTPHLLVLAQHPFANYVVSTLATLDLMHASMVAAFRGALVRLLCNTQGSRVVQALLSALPAADAEKFISELDGHVLQTSLDTHGSWGVSAAFECTRAQFILSEVSHHVVALATQQNGCRVAQAVFKTAGSAGMDLAPAVARMLGGGIDCLAAHCFANYVLQVLLRHSGSPQRDPMIKMLIPHVLSLSTSKHGSNVAESVLSLAPQRMLESVCDRVFGAVSAAGSASEPAGDALRSLIEHPFGNYVLQTLMRRLVNASRRSNAIDKIRASAAPGNYGRSILARLGAD